MEEMNLKTASSFASIILRQSLPGGVFLDEDKAMAEVERLVSAERLAPEDARLVRVDPQELMERLEPGEGRALREEYVWLPQWIFDWRAVVDVAVVEAASRGLLPPPPSTALALWSGLKLEDEYRRISGIDTATVVAVWSRFLEDASNLLREAEEKGISAEALEALLKSRLVELAGLSEEVREVRRELTDLGLALMRLNGRLEPLYRAVLERLEKL